MKRLLLFCLLAFVSTSSFAQYAGNGNDWVEFDKTYYKFAVSEDGIYRLSKDDLLAAGIPESELQGSSFKMIRNGVEVPLFVSTNGNFSTSDFIEFFGEMNTGDVDTGLYSSPLQQPGTSRSLFSDTSIHFLTIDSSGSHARITQIANDLTNLPAPEEFYMAKIVKRPGYNDGRYIRISDVNLYESGFDNCEGYTSQVNRTRLGQFDFEADNIVTTANADLSVHVKIASRVNTSSIVLPGPVEFSIGSSTVITQNIAGRFEFEEFNFTFSPADISGNSRFRIRNNSEGNIKVSERTLIYPRAFEFAEMGFARVNLAKSGSRFLRLQNVPVTGNNLVVYDLSTNQRITETIGTTTQIRTSSASTNNNLIIDNNTAAPEFVGEVDFIDISSENFDFLVISHPEMETLINGENYVQKFIDHKSTTLGGSWNMLKVDIEQVIDQYAFGVRGHSAATKNLVLELNDLNKLPQHILLIGKGYEFQQTLAEEVDEDYIPTYGNPGSDSQLVTEYGSEVMLTSIGRISARNNVELQYYVDKVIDYQTLIDQTDDAVQTKDKLWMKNGMHLGGGINASQQSAFRQILNNLGTKFAKPNFGGETTSFFKNTTDPIQDVDLASIDSLISSGLSMINYFGHSAINSLEFNISDFSQYEQEGRYPFMITNGCFVGDLYQSRKSLSEDFVLIQDAGTLSFMGPSQFGIAPGMTAFSNKFYTFFVEDNYGSAIGDAIVFGHNDISSSSWITKLTKQQMIFHGDPSLPIYPHEKADYLVTAEDVTFEPNNITADVEEFDVQVVISNIGKAFEEPIDVRVTRTLPNGEEIVLTQPLDNVYYQDTITFTFQTNALISEGLNEFMVEIDPNDELDEITRANNSLGMAIGRPIINDIAKPILPREFGVTTNENVELIAYTSSFTITPENFDYQIDTTELFNSPLLTSNTITSRGGTLRWQPNLSYQDETVYYWRVKRNVSDEEDWFSSSFVFNDTHDEGWNQSHYYQYLKNDYENLLVDDLRNFEFGTNQRNLNVRTAMFPVIPHNQTTYSIDGVLQARKRCTNNHFMVAIMDELTGEPLVNINQGGGLGLYNSKFCGDARLALFYNVNTPDNRKDFMDMLDQVPEGKFVLIFSANPLQPLAFNWASDEALFGYTLQDKLEENGATSASQITEDAPYIFYFQKGNLDFTEMNDIAGTAADEIIDENFLLPVKFAEGEFVTPLIGPAASWDEVIFEWDNSLDDDATGDQILYDVIGVRANESESVLFTNVADTNFSIASIDATEFTHLRIRVKFKDESNFTAAQLQKLRVIYEDLPEMAINIVDIIDNSPFEFFQNESVTIRYTLENIYTKDMDPVLVDYTYNQAAGGSTTEELRYDALPAGETMQIEYELNTASQNLVGDNLLFIDSNPDDDQPEQYHFNNIALVEFSIDKDEENPLLDVTFDGVHIIDGDLVADTPEILITLTDENEFLLLNNPDDFEIVVLHPGNTTPTVYSAASPEITFYPASNADDNKAVIEFKPEFVPGIYEMRVQATDRSQNEAGENDYLISFEVTDEDIITQVINYPNPFTTSTEFIARIVGEVPDEVLIQIFTPSGRVIRELHASAGEIQLSQGNNYYSIAQWDGTDEFGDPIGNGVYFYKISMKRNGELIDAHDSERYRDYFHDGIGKLYILR